MKNSELEVFQKSNYGHSRAGRQCHATTLTELITNKTTGSQLKRKVVIFVLINHEKFGVRGIPKVQLWSWQGRKTSPCNHIDRIHNQRNKWLTGKTEICHICSNQPWEIWSYRDFLSPITVPAGQKNNVVQPHWPQMRWSICVCVASACEEERHNVTTDDSS